MDGEAMGDEEDLEQDYTFEAKVAAAERQALRQAAV